MNPSQPADAAKSKQSVFPVRISENGRYLVDRDGAPFLYHADTCWKLFWEFTEEEAGIYLADRQQMGFTAIQVQLLPHRDYQANRDGQTPFLVRGDLTTPNPAYFSHVDTVARLAEDLGVGLMIAPIWASRWEQDWYKHLNLKNAAIFARYLAERYRSFPAIIGWMHGGDDDALALHACIRVFGQTVKALAPVQINTFHANQKGGWTFFNQDDWYDMNMAYSYSYGQMVGQMTEAYQLAPVRPVVLGETHYEYNTGISSALLRRFAYASVILGCAGQTYGHKDIWIATCFWREAMHAPVAWQMREMARLFTSVAWQDLLPDLDHAFVINGYGDPDTYAPSAVTSDGQLAVVYIPAARRVVVNGGKLANNTQASWFDPASGASKRAEPCETPDDALGDASGKMLAQAVGTSSGRRFMVFETPGVNDVGDEDWLLIFKPD